MPVIVADPTPSRYADRTGVMQIFLSGRRKGAPQGASLEGF
jgi:hypothetical protein